MIKAIFSRDELHAWFGFGLGIDVMDSGFGAFQSNGNKRDYKFYLKSGINYIDKKLMGAAVLGTTLQQNNLNPIYSDDPASRDLQLAGHEEFLD